MGQPNFIAAYIVDAVAKPEPLLLLLKRASDVYLPGIWQIVTGKVNAGETILHTVKREVSEETGLKISQAYNVNITLFYERSKDQVGYSANFLVFLDQRTEITLSPKEHSEFRWCSFAKARELLAFASQRETLAHLNEFYIKDVSPNANQASLLQL